MNNVRGNLSNFKSKVLKLDVGKLVPAPVDLSKPSDVVKTDVVTKDVYNAKIKEIEDGIPDITNLATNTILNVKINEVIGEIPSFINLSATTTTFNAKINEVKNKISNITDSAATTALTAVENKITYVSDIFKTSDC